MVVGLPVRHVRMAGVGAPGSRRRRGSAYGAGRCRQRGRPRSAERHVAGGHLWRLHLLHRYARAVVARPRRHLSRSHAHGGGLLRRLAGAADHRSWSRPALRQHHPTAAVRVDHPAAGRAGGFLHSGGLSIRLGADPGPPRERGVLQPAHPGLQGVAAAEDRRGRPAHHLCHRHRACAAALARHATRRAADVRRKGCARDAAASDRPGGSSRVARAGALLLCACYRTTLKRYHATGSPCRCMSRPSRVTRYSPGPKAPEFSDTRTWPFESLARPSKMPTRPWLTRSMVILNIVNRDEERSIFISANSPVLMLSAAPAGGPLREGSTMMVRLRVDGTTGRSWFSTLSFSMLALREDTCRPSTRHPT